MQDEMSKMKEELSKKVDDAISGKNDELVARMKQTKMLLVILELVSMSMEREYIQT